jgi:hypothetical protein
VRAALALNCLTPDLSRILLAVAVDAGSLVAEGQFRLHVGLVE